MGFLASCSGTSTNLKKIEYCRMDFTFRQVTSCPTNGRHHPNGVFLKKFFFMSLVTYRVFQNSSNKSSLIKIWKIYKLQGVQVKKNLVLYKMV